AHAVWEMAALDLARRVAGTLERAARRHEPGGPPAVAGAISRALYAAAGAAARSQARTYRSRAGDGPPRPDVGGEVRVGCALRRDAEFLARSEDSAAHRESGGVSHGHQCRRRRNDAGIQRPGRGSPHLREIAK